MATQPAMQGMDPSADPSQDPDQGDSQGGFCIEIHASADGKLTVSVEPEAEETQEEGGEADDGDEGQPVANIKEALTLALSIYKNKGEMPDDEGSDDAFSQGLGARSTGY